MENRSELVKELFELRVYLNKSNQKSNQKTELKFEIRQSTSSKFQTELICCLSGIKSTAFVVLSRKTDKLKWIWPNPVHFPHLSEFFSNELNSNTVQDNRLLNSMLKKLTSLGIS